MSALADHIARLLVRADGAAVCELAEIHYEVMESDEHTERLRADLARERTLREEAERERERLQALAVEYAETLAKTRQELRDAVSEKHSAFVQGGAAMHRRAQAAESRALKAERQAEAQRKRADSEMAERHKREATPIPEHALTPTDGGARQADIVIEGGAMRGGKVAALMAEGRAMREQFEKRIAPMKRPTEERHAFPESGPPCGWCAYKEQYLDAAEQREADLKSDRREAREVIAQAAATLACSPDQVVEAARLLVEAHEATKRERDEAQHWKAKAEQALAHLSPNGRPGVQLYLDDDSGAPGMPMFGIVETYSPFIVADKANEDGSFDVYQWRYDEESFSCEMQAAGYLIDDDWLCTEVEKRDAAIARAERAEAERDHYKRACVETAREIENALGAALFGEQAPADEAPAWCVYTSEELALLAAKRIRDVEAERDAYKRDFDAELAGNGEMRKRFGARENETMWMFHERAEVERDALKAKMERVRDACRGADVDRGYHVAGSLRAVLAILNETET